MYQVMVIRQLDGCILGPVAPSCTCYQVYQTENASWCKRFWRQIPNVLKVYAWEVYINSLTWTRSILKWQHGIEERIRILFCFLSQDRGTGITVCFLAQEGLTGITVCFLSRGTYWYHRLFPRSRGTYWLVSQCNVNHFSPRRKTKTDGISENFLKRN